MSKLITEEFEINVKRRLSTAGSTIEAMKSFVISASNSSRIKFVSLARSNYISLQELQDFCDDLQAAINQIRKDSDYIRT